tara:strand:+ start:224 stop:457 length:234 start_codon:yes stop_codon:yes gene_type:complete
MKDLIVTFLEQVDSESRTINVHNDRRELIAFGSLNLCSNMAHITILPEYEQAYEDMQFDIEKAIEERDIMHNRILVN